ncbi:MAG TPA: carboxylating nicotinate-nucleotide diphosphorylase [Candidatus Acidoferrales bacterium]|nr:carboxylating nicotinate-nucleotide diphosphorylase [Candidatus Acidoferrales bacterium]
MNSRTEVFREKVQGSREGRVRAAFYHGGDLTFENSAYLRAFRDIAEELLREDAEAGDLTVEAMGIGDRKCAVEIRAKEAGVVAGIAEAAWLYERAGAALERPASDGEFLNAGGMLLRVESDAATLLSLERVAVNLLQRMSGIATATRKLVELARNASSTAHVIATRKTLWGLLDKRAVHCGGAGTHRLNLGDAVLIKTNHLRLASNGGAMDLESAIKRAWENRNDAKFFEVEAATPEEAVKVAGILGKLQAQDFNCPCILMLDNFSPANATSTAAALRDAGLHDGVLVEASGNISETSIAEYAASGVDAVSVGALTHSARALDLSAKLIPIPR